MSDNEDIVDIYWTRHYDYWTRHYDEYTKTAQDTQATLPDVPHYGHLTCGVEWKDISGDFSYNIGTALSYLGRAEYKHDCPIEDYEKARDHIEFEITRLKRLKSLKSR